MTRIMFVHIKSHLPDIMKEIKERVTKIDERLKSLGSPMPDNIRDKSHLLWNMVTEFVTVYNSTINGKYDQGVERKQNKELTGGARIKQNFEELYREYSHVKFSATQGYSDLDIEKAIILHEGDQLPGFPSVDVFQYLIKPQLEELREPAMECLSEVHMYLESMANDCAT